MAGEGVMKFTDDNFETEVIDSKVPVLVDFWAEWCQPCRMLEPTINDLAAEFKGRAKIGKVDTDANRDITIKYQINAVPTLLLFKGGNLEKKYVGMQSKSELADALNELAAV
jgi:thioredoxin 1